MITKDTPKKLFLLDAYALIYRAFFAFSTNPRVNSQGLNTSAIFGFTNTLLEILNKEKPTHMAVVFDSEGDTHRHAEFTAYKANREEMPEDLRSNIPYIMDLIRGFNIPVIAMAGYEADDIIGTLAKEAEAKGFTTYMMTPDKDFGQLVDENTFIYKPARLGNGAEIMGVAEVCKKWEITSVAQVIDILGLMGDKVDNIPGIPGVGEKTAIQLIKDFGSIENMLANTDKLKGKLKEKVEANAEMARQSKWLATIITDVPVHFNEEELGMKEVNKDVLRELFKVLEFRRIAQQVLNEDIGGSETEKAAAPTKKSKTQPGQGNLFGEDSVDLFTPQGTGEETGPAQEARIFKTIADVAHTYHLVEGEEKIRDLAAMLEGVEEFCFDTETTGLNALDAEIVGMSFSVKPGEGYYINMPAEREASLAVLNIFKPLFEDSRKTLIGQNIKYDLQILGNYGIEVKNKLWDTMVAHFLIQPEMRHNMNVLAETYLGYSPVSIETLIGKKGKGGQSSMRDVPLEQIKEYASEDADITLQLKQLFAPKLKEIETEKLFTEVEVPLIQVLADMEREGIKLDVANLKDFSQQLQNDIVQVEASIQELAGTKFNVSSPKQVGEILFDYLKIIDKPKKTKTGQYATSEDILIKLENKHPIVSKILDYRELVKLKSTYVDALPLMVNANTGRIHTSFNQVVAVTGRLSSDNPNLQNIPIRTERGRQIRKAFIPRDADHVLLSADYSQIELRVVASISGDPNMSEAFNSGKDIHTATAARVYGVEESAVTKEMRYKSKSVNFGIIYGQGPFGLAENLGIPRAEAKQLIDNYFAQYGGIKTYMDTQVNFARENGYVKTLLGRKRWLKDITSNNQTVRSYAERNAINAPIQGSSADMIKVAMIRIHDELKKRGLKSKMVLQVHDELVFDVYKPELDIVKPIIEKHMQEALKLSVPVEVGMGVGDNWLEAH